MFTLKIKKYLSPKKCLALSGLLTMVLLGIVHPLQAQSVTQGYGADQTLQRGMLVGIKKKDAGKVEPVNTDSIERLHGVVVDANDAPVSISSEGQQVFVASTGKFDALVSNQNGPIAIGDYITASAISGIGMKAGNGQAVVLGKALASFDNDNDVLSTAEVNDKSNSKRNVNISRIPVDIAVAKNPLIKIPEPNLPGFLRKASEGVAGKPVNPIRVYVGFAVFLAVVSVAGVLLYAGVRSSFIAIGRNPLSKRSIVHGLIQVVLTSLIIFISGMTGIYFILKG